MIIIIIKSVERGYKFGGEVISLSDTNVDQCFWVEIERLEIKFCYKFGSVIVFFVDFLFYRVILKVG